MLQQLSVHRTLYELYEDFATIDLISNGRAEIIAGRARVLVYLICLDLSLRDYEELFEEKLSYY